MPRLHLIELHEQPWFPTPLRQATTDYLQTISRLAGAHRAFAPHIDALLAASGADQVVDLCSGSSGPWLELAPLLSQPVSIQLTDLYPHSIAGISARGITAHPDPVDATAVTLPGLRTIFNAFHHFRPDAARAILADAFAQRQPLVMAELSARSPATILTAPFIPLFVLLVVPFMRPVRPLVLLLTYLLPILPLVVFFDGMVSHLRCYTPAELEAMVSDLQAEDYRWQVQTLPLGSGPATFTLLTGSPIRLDDLAGA